MNGFNSKVVCKNSSVAIWEILFNIAIPIIHHKYRGGFPATKGTFVKQPVYTPGVLSGGSRIFPRGGREPSRGGGVNTPNFPENCMKSKEFGRPGGACVPHAPLDPCTGTIPGNLAL